MATSASSSRKQVALVTTAADDGDVIVTEEVREEPEEVVETFVVEDPAQLPELGKQTLKKTENPSENVTVDEVVDADTVLDEHGNYVTTTTVTTVTTVLVDGDGPDEVEYVEQEVEVSDDEADAAASAPPPAPAAIAPEEVDGEDDGYYEYFYEGEGEGGEEEEEYSGDEEEAQPQARQRPVAGDAAVVDAAPAAPMTVQAAVSQADERDEEEPSHEEVVIVEEGAEEEVETGSTTEVNMSDLFSNSSFRPSEASPTHSLPPSVKPPSPPVAKAQSPVKSPSPPPPPPLRSPPPPPPSSQPAQHVPAEDDENEDELVEYVYEAEGEGAEEEEEYDDTEDEMSKTSPPRQAAAGKGQGVSEGSALNSSIFSSEGDSVGGSGAARSPEIGSGDANEVTLDARPSFQFAQNLYGKEPEVVEVDNSLFSGRPGAHGFTIPAVVTGADQDDYGRGDGVAAGAGSGVEGEGEPQLWRRPFSVQSQTRNFTQRERDGGERTVAFQTRDGHTVVLPDGHAYELDRALPFEDKQKHMGALTEAATRDALRGYNRCILFHGHHESARGKMFEDYVYDICQRLCNQRDALERNPQSVDLGEPGLNASVAFNYSVVQLCGDDADDLIRASQGEESRVRVRVLGNSLQLEGLDEHKGEDPDVMKDMVQQALTARSYVSFVTEDGESQLRSVSHLLVTFNVFVSTWVSGEEDKEPDVYESRIVCVDLVPAVRTNRGGRMVLSSEGIRINQSVLATRNVLRSLATPPQPGDEPLSPRQLAAKLRYRETKLTMLLKDFFIHPYSLAVVLALSPRVVDLDRTRQTLQFGLFNDTPQLPSSGRRTPDDSARLSARGKGAAAGTDSGQQGGAADQAVVPSSADEVGAAANGADADATLSPRLGEEDVRQYGEVKVVTRVRPFTDEEKEASGDGQPESIVHISGFNGQQVSLPNDNNFKVDTAFPPSASDDVVLGRFKSLIDNALRGKNAVVFGYGAKSGDKLASLFGTPDEPREGLMSSLQQELRRRVEAGVPDMDNVRWTSAVLDVDGDQIADLLGPKSGKRIIIRTAANGETVLDNVVTRRVDGETLWQVPGVARRLRALENGAPRSLTSLVYIMYVQATHVPTGDEVVGKIALVDLPTPEQALYRDVVVPGSSIPNQTLAHLRNTIRAIAEASARNGRIGAHPRFRDNKLTHLLRDCMELHAKILLYAHVSPMTLDMEDDILTMQFGDIKRDLGGRYDQHRNAAFNFIEAGKTAAPVDANVGDVRVMSRIRPLSEAEDQGAEGADPIGIARIADDDTIYLTNGKSFLMDHVYGPESSQTDLFASAAELVDWTLQGNDASMMFYGEHGAGKSFTLIGENEWGVLPQCLNRVFEQAKSLQESAGVQVTVRASVVRLSGTDTVADLLRPAVPESAEEGAEAPAPARLALRVTRNGEVYIENALVMTLRNMEDAALLLESVGVNAASDVGVKRFFHTVYIVYVDIDVPGQRVPSRGKLLFVDLASQVTPEDLEAHREDAAYMREAVPAADSLKALEDVLTNLSLSPDQVVTVGTVYKKRKLLSTEAEPGQKLSRAPLMWRQSKLTMLLHMAFQRKYKSILYVCISPFVGSLPATTHALRFGFFRATILMRRRHMRANPHLTHAPDVQNLSVSVVDPWKGAGGKSAAGAAGVPNAPVDGRVDDDAASDSQRSSTTPSQHGRAPIGQPGDVTVAVMVRPFYDDEDVWSEMQSVTCPSEDTVVLTDGKAYRFHVAHDFETSMPASENYIESVTEHALQGFGASVFCYGSMDSGKALEENSFSSEMLGLVCHRLFQRKVDEDTATVTVRASILELRGDNLVDLLARETKDHLRKTPHILSADAAPKKNRRPRRPDFVLGSPAEKLAEVSQRRRALGTRPPAIRSLPNGEVRLDNTVVMPVDTYNDLMELLSDSLTHRSSYKAHVVVTLWVEIFQPTSNTSTVGKICFVELATAVPPSQLTAEELNPNPSLAAFQNVLHKLIQGRAPWRESKIAMLCRDCLQPPAKCLLFLHVAPIDADIDGSRQTMMFGRSVLGPRASLSVTAKTVSREGSPVRGPQQQANASLSSSSLVNVSSASAVGAIGDSGVGVLRVYCRIRPLNRLEMEHGEFSPAVDMPDDHTVRVRTLNKNYEFFGVDRALDYNVAQDEVAASVDDVLEWVLAGHESCIISYGQLGAGKTHTMLGEPRDPGLLARSLNRIFMRTPEQMALQQEEDPDSYVDHDLVVTDVVWSILQVCGDDIADLLYEPQSEDEIPPKLSVHMSKSRNRAFVRGAVHMRVDCFEDAMLCLEEAMSRRTPDRSHLLFRIVVTLRSRSDPATSGVQGTLMFADLAGPERALKTKKEIEVKADAVAVNQSLNSLRNLLRSMMDPSMHRVPRWRENKLTMLLQHVFQRTFRTILFLHVSPSLHDVDETLNTLHYAGVKNVKEPHRQPAARAARQPTHEIPQGVMWMCTQAAETPARRPFGRVRVLTRIRPFTNAEWFANPVPSMDVEENCSITFPNGPSRRYNFDEVFDHTASQEAVYAPVSALVESLFSGGAAAVLYYGLGSARKEFSMRGNSNEPGTIPRAFAAIMAKRADIGHRGQVRVRLSVLEVLEDHIHDLLGSGENGGVTYELDGQHLFLRNASLLVLEDEPSVPALLDQVVTRRESFRSHIVYTFFVDTYRALTREVITGKLVFVDLAHSLVDRAAKVTEHDMNPNPSLALLRSLLRDVSTRRNQHDVSYADNTLGLLIKDCLEGRGESILFLHVSPMSWDLENSLQTLDFGSLHLDVSLSNDSARQSVDVAASSPGPLSPEAR